jgi:hypothetical protein
LEPNEDPEEIMNKTERSEYDDEDKILYQKIGKTEVNVDKILKMLLV